MKRIAVFAAALATVGMLAAPALADHKIGGYFRTQAIMSNTNFPMFNDDGDMVWKKDQQPKKWVDNRIRAKWTNNINEYVSTVWYVEADFPWGMAGSVPSGSTETGGKWGADGVNIETKNAFAKVVVPDTPLTATVGIFGFGDNFHSVLFNDDIAGIKLDAKLGMADVVALWSKAEEGNQVDEDDIDLYWLEANLKPADAVTAGLTGAWKHDQADSVDNYFVGVNGGFKMDMVDLDGFFVYNFGKSEEALDNGDDEDISAWALGLNAKAKLDAVKVGGGVLVMSKDDDNKEDGSFNGGQGAFQVYDAGLQIFLADIYYNNQGGRGAGGRLAITDASDNGFGLIGLWANAAADLPAVEGMYVKGAVGYFMAMDDKAESGDDEYKVEGKNLGLELSAQVGVKVAGKADVSLRGAYAMLGDFYDKTAIDKDGNAADPDNLYNVVLMLNVPY